MSSRTQPRTTWWPGSTISGCGVRSPSAPTHRWISRSHHAGARHLGARRRRARRAGLDRDRARPGSCPRRRPRRPMSPPSPRRILAAGELEVGAAIAHPPGVDSWHVTEPGDPRTLTPGLVRPARVFAGLAVRDREGPRSVGVCAHVASIGRRPGSPRDLGPDGIGARGPSWPGAGRARWTSTNGEELRHASTRVPRSR